MKNVLMFSVFAMLLGSCKPLMLAVDDRLNEDTTFMEVEGRTVWAGKKDLTFGEFVTTNSSISRTWKNSYDISFLVNFQGAKEKLRYAQMDTLGNVAEVFGVNLYKESGVGQYFNIRTKHESYYAGTIVLDKGKTVWEYIVNNPTAPHTDKDFTNGFITKGKQRIEIEGVKKYVGQRGHSLTPHGYQFKMDDKAIGAVSMNGRGQVWIRQDLDTEIRLVLASLSTGLLLRDHIDDGDF
jgi:hypothetical protein